MATDFARALRGQRILVVEDSYFVATAIAATLSLAGAEVVGPVARVDDARAILDIDHTISAAFLDVNVDNELIWPIVDVLISRRLPLVLATSYDWQSIPAAYAHLPRCEKSANGQRVAQALADQALADPTLRHG